MVDANTVAEVVAAIGPLAAVAVAAGLKWLKSEAVIVEQKLAASNMVKKLEESNAQGDSIASMGKMLISDIVVGAQAIPTLKPIVDKLNDIYNLSVAGWNNEQFTTDQMNALVKDFETVYALLKPAAPKPA